MRLVAAPGRLMSSRQLCWASTLKSVCRYFPGCVVILSVTSPAPASDKIDKAVERGVIVLLRSQQPNGSWGAYGAGSTSLAALALLESGVAADNPAIVKAADFVRTEIIANYETYHVSLAIMFLDRLGDRADVPLIQALGVRLMEGQQPWPQAGWNYRTTQPSEDEVTRLRNLHSKKVELKTSPKKPDDKTSSGEMDPDLVRRVEAMDRTGVVDPSRRASPAHQSNPDNSNSQFAVLALWIARRNGVPADISLRRAEAWYRITHENGTWAYILGGGTPYGRGATTCAGLLGLAVGAGIARTPVLKTKPDDKTAAVPKRDPLSDLLVRTALSYVVGELASMTRADVPSNGLDRDYYFLWSLERVGMVYGVTKVAGVDWYALGSTLILLHEQPTGGWKGRYAIEIDTSFALLFLRRSNLVPDLSAALKPKQQHALTAKDPAVEDHAKKQLPGMTAAGEADKLARELLTANADQHLRILERLRDEKGAEYSDAIVAVIPQLSEELKRKARDCLAERMARMTTETIRAKMSDANAEYRRAAALACAVKEERALIGDLIKSLEDREFFVVRAAAVALQSLTGEDFGPTSNATAEQKTKSIAAWKAWWKKQTP